ncbi:hypothetical protein Golob_026524, partial [Gossypium lobatum]|nr:hypothetical protein [Gossypium lobatum]
METIRFDIEKFDGVKNFNLWQVQMMAILVQTGLKKGIAEDIDGEDLIHLVEK